MVDQSTSSTLPLSAERSREHSRAYVEGIVAGIIGAAAIAVWFSVLDLMSGRPLYTPTVLGTALFRNGAELYSQQTLATSVELTLLYTGIHTLVFVVIGGVIGRLLSFVESNADAGFGVVLLFVILGLGFIAGNFVFARPILHALAWPAVVVGDILAAAAMAGFFWYRHPHMQINP